MSRRFSELFQSHTETGRHAGASVCARGCVDCGRVALSLAALIR